MAKHLGRPTSFTLVELLTVMAIIAILAGLILYAGSGVMKETSRSRARSEIAGLSAAMESYKADNGVYPSLPNGGGTFASTNAYSPVNSAMYELSSELVYQSLTGMTNVTDTPLPGTKSYFAFKKSQIGSDGTTAYIKDPFGTSYGYFNGNGAELPYNGTNSFDLWSTGGDTTMTNLPAWVSNFGT